jgi:hypothetical protein
MNLEDLLRSMRENELLYANIEAEYTVEGQTVLEEELLNSKSFARHGLMAYHVIFQDMLYYARSRYDAALVNGRHIEYTTEIGCG